MARFRSPTARGENGFKFPNFAFHFPIYTKNQFLKHLTTLARLRKLDHKIKHEVYAMPIEYDIKTDAFYLEGLEKGRNEGIEEGRQEGKQKAIEAFLLRGQLSEQDIADTLEVPLEYVLEIKRSIKA